MASATRANGKSVAMEGMIAGRKYHGAEQDVGRDPKQRGGVRGKSDILAE